MTPDDPALSRLRSLLQTLVCDAGFAMVYAPETTPFLRRQYAAIARQLASIDPLFARLPSLSEDAPAGAVRLVARSALARIDVYRRHRNRGLWPQGACPALTLFYGLFAVR